MLTGILHPALPDYEIIVSKKGEGDSTIIRSKIPSQSGQETGKNP
jgi:hypothetical protein